MRSNRVDKVALRAGDEWRRQVLRIRQIEAKGIDPIRLKNHVRVIMTSKESSVVPAGPDERRFAVLDEPIRQP
jgi:hypothetical protein